jgi:hypothetical protein
MGLKALIKLDLNDATTQQRNTFYENSAFLLVLTASAFLHSSLYKLHCVPGLYASFT